MRTLLDLLKLKPHGDNLCNSKAEIWLLLLRSSVLLIAGCEAAAWGYIGYLMTGGPFRWVAAVLIGGAVGCLIAGLDAAFVMVDLSKMRREPAPGSPAAPQSSRLAWVASWLQGRLTKAHLGALVRVVMVAVSLTITAPFLAQLLFSQDISARLQQANNTILAESRARIVGKFQGEQEMLRTELQRLEDARSREIAGRGLSRRFGAGPVSESLAAQAETIRKQIDDSERNEAGALARFDEGNPEALAREYGVLLAADGIVTRFNTLEEMKEIPGFQWTENAFRILLAGFFFGLLIFKWYEPRSLEIYFDEELQSAHDDFQRGRYNHLLPAGSFGPDDPPSPLSFSEWYYSTAKLREQSNALKERLAAITDRQRSFEEAAAQLAGDPGSEMEALQARRAEIVAALEPLRLALRREADEAARIATEVALCEAELAKASSTLTSISEFEEIRTFHAVRRSWEDRLRAARQAQVSHQNSLAEVRYQHEVREKELKLLDSVLEKTGRALAELSDSITNARVNAVRALGETH